jgi:hypothetical protein
MKGMPSIYNYSRYFLAALWNLDRFGLAPRKLASRFHNQSAPRIFSVSIPKSGTHLLERALCLHPRLYRRWLPTIRENNVGKWGDFNSLLKKLRPGQIVVSHLGFSKNVLRTIEQEDIKGILMMRDPRDIVVSQMHYIIRRKKHPRHGVFWAQQDDKKRLELAILGHKETHLTSIGDRLAEFYGWLENGFLPVRFEELIGPRGGGGATEQMRVIRQIYGFLGVDLDPRTAKRIAGALFSSVSPTFRKGTVGGWREYFDLETTHLFKAVAGDSIVKYGYEKDHHW